MGMIKEKFRKIAQICMLDIQGEEADLLLKDINGVIDSVDRLLTIDVEGVESTFSVLKDPMLMRLDAIGEMLTQEEALKNAFKRQKEYFEIPKLLESKDE